MIIDKASELPLYSQVKQALQREINKGGFKPGERIPAERELADEFNVSRITANRAIRDLVQEGILYREQGKGTFVCETGLQPTSENVGLVISRAKSKNSSFYLEIFKGVEEVISSSECNLVFSSLEKDEKEFKRPFRLIEEGHVDGLILIELWREDFLRRLITRKIPIVLVDWESDIEGVDSVVVDDRQATYEAVCYLHSLGHEWIGFINGPENILTYRDRLAGYKEALQDLGLYFHKDLVCKNGPWFEKGAAQLKKMLSQGITAITGASDELVHGAVEVFQSWDIKVPEHISAVGLGGLSNSGDIYTRLTTMQIDWQDMGRQAAQVLLARINGDKRTIGKIKIPGTLVVGNSCKEVSQEHKK